MLSRREFALLAAAAGLGAAAPLGSLAWPVIVAEGGSAEKRIEDTRPALDLAIDQGCDFIQCAFTPSRDGTLVARRDNELSLSTDVAAHPAFADRKATKSFGGHKVTGWFAEDFTVAELKTLACREALPQVRPQNVKYDGKDPILTLAEVLAVARQGCV
ncbi:MAG: glycerophosphodiester phosphodiesterase family protein, partial [Caulobacteraceae bacterium]